MKVSLTLPKPGKLGGIPCKVFNISWKPISLNSAATDANSSDISTISPLCCFVNSAAKFSNTKGCWSAPTGGDKVDALSICTSKLFPSILITLPVILACTLGSTDLKVIEVS